MMFGDRRAADAFQRLLDGETPPLRTREEERLLGVVTALREVPPVEARPEFVASLRSRLLAEAATALVPGPEVERLTLPDRRSGSTPRSRRLGVALGGFALVGAASSMAVASTAVLPGDSLYPIKQMVENGRGAFAQGDAAQGRHQLDRATTRLSEAASLAISDDPRDDEALPATLDAFTEQATEGAELLLTHHADTGDEASIEALKDFSASSLHALADLAPMLPPEAGDELSLAATRVATIGAQASMMCPECGGAPYVGVPTALEPFVPSQYAGPSGVVESPAPGSQQQGEGQGTSLPDIDPSDLPPASVTDPDDLPDAPTAGLDDVRDPVQDLTDTVTQTIDDLSLPQVDVPGTVDGVTGTVDDTVDGVLGGLSGAVGETTDKVGDPTDLLP